jgi:hypothetical protein
VESSSCCRVICVAALPQLQCKPWLSICLHPYPRIVLIAAASSAARKRKCCSPGVMGMAAAWTGEATRRAVSQYVCMCTHVVRCVCVCACMGVCMYVCTCHVSAMIACGTTAILQQTREQQGQAFANRRAGMRRPSNNR